MPGRDDEETNRKSGIAYAAALTLFVSVATLCGVGWLLDRWLGTKPNATQSGDRKSTRLNSSHVRISYAVFCLDRKIKLMNSSYFLCTNVAFSSQEHRIGPIRLGLVRAWGEVGACGQLGTVARRSARCGDFLRSI